MLFGRVGPMDVHQAKASKDAPDIWVTENRPELIVFDLSENHRDTNKIRYYLRKGFKVLKWDLPTGEKFDPESGRSSFDEIEAVLREAMERDQMKAELETLRTERTAFEQKVDEKKVKNVGRATREGSTATDQG